jgi:ABC-type uncharacterized transport system permease subunit
MLSLFTLVAIGLYLIASQWQMKQFATQQGGPRNRIQAFGFIAVIFQLIATLQIISGGFGLNLSFFVAGSMISIAVVVLLLLGSLRHKLDNLFMWVFPMAAITLALAYAFPGEGTKSDYSAGLLSHILLSIISYSLFTLAALQALLLSKQEHALKSHKTRGLLNTLPPLQVMENLLFELITAGQVVLTLALISGYIYTDDLFAQHLAHKTLLSLGAWVIFTILLTGRAMFGWRSRTALRWTLSGFVLLMLGFFGSKAVLELILGA